VNGSTSNDIPKGEGGGTSSLLITIRSDIAKGGRKKTAEVRMDEKKSLFFRRGGGGGKRRRRFSCNGPPPSRGRKSKANILKIREGKLLFFNLLF